MLPDVWDGIMKTLFVVLCWLICVPLAMACTCVETQGTNTMLDIAKWQVQKAGADEIFEGTVTAQEVKNGSAVVPASAMSMTPSGKHREVMIRVTRGYRGTFPETAMVLTGLGEGDCGFDFETGQSYLVFANYVDAGVFSTSICSGTTLLDRAGAALRYLQSEKPTADDLLSPNEYYRRMLPKWTGSICGEVVGPDGKPVKGASVEAYEVRGDELPPRVFSDPELTRQDGTYCILSAEPGNYLLTAEKEDDDASARLMGFYPGVKRHSDAVPFEVDAGESQKRVDFGLFREQLYTVKLRVVTSDGTPAPAEHLGIKIDSLDQDPLAYHEYHGVENDGTYTLGLIPPGKYLITTYFEPVVEPNGAYELAPEASAWLPVHREVDIVSNGTVDVTLQRVPGR